MNIRSNRELDSLLNTNRKKLHIPEKGVAKVGNKKLRENPKNKKKPIKHSFKSYLDDLV